MLKKHLSIIVILLSFYSTSFGQWEWLNPQPTGFSCSKIFFSDDQNGIILNSNGDLLKTSNQGASWQLNQNFKNAISMDMRDSTVAIVGSLGFIYISRDYGNTWIEKNMSSYDYLQFVNVISNDTIFVANSSGKIFRTYDGGNSWQTLNCGKQISSIEFINSKIGYAGASSTYILKTTDGGNTWQENVATNISPSNTLAVKFFDINTGFAFREHSDLLSTTDGGVTWKIYDIGDDIHAFHFITSQIGFAAGEHGVIYRTDNGGVSWTLISTDGRISGNDIRSIYFINENTGFAVGLKGRILKTIDGGNSWKSYSPFYIQISDLALASSNTAYATVANNIYKTDDSGKSWQQLELMVGTEYADHSQFQKAHFFNEDTGFVTASLQARIYKTYNGGVTWKQLYVTQYGYDYITDVQFLNNNTGYLAVYINNQGTIVKTTDQGETWNQIWTPQYYGEYFQKLFFLDEKTGYASRYNRLFKTEDSAKTWTELWQGERITAIWFTNAETGFVCGENGMLQRSNDSGKTWSRIPVTSQYYDDIYNIKFIDPKVGYFTAENGVFKSIDSGLTWQHWDKSHFLPLNAIKFGADSTVYLAGDNGTILRSDVSEYRIDSFHISHSNCNIDFEAAVTTVLTTVDSIKFEYGINSFDKTIDATPSSVDYQHQKVKATITDFIPSTNYQVRLKYYFNGAFYYSNEYNFRSYDKPATPVVAIDGNTTFCSGDSVILNSSATSGNQWFLDGIAITNATNQKYVATQAGKYQLIRNLNCINSDTASILLKEEPSPPPPSISLNGNLLTSSASSGNQWYLNGTIITGATQSIYTATTSGNYSVRVTDNNCTSSFSPGVAFVITSINSPTLVKNMEIGPNPVSNQLTINYNGNASNFGVSISNIFGIIVYRKNFYNHININMRSLPAGLYIIDIKNLRTNEQMRNQIIKN